MSLFRGSFLIMRQHPRMMSTVPSLSRLRLQDGVDQYEIQVHDKCMAVKTIIIDMEAYEILSRFKDGRKSFSQVIKDELGRKRTGRDLKARDRTAANERGCRRCHRSSNPCSAAPQSPGSEAVIHLDTSFLVDLLRETSRGKPGPASAFLVEIENEQLAASVFVQCELYAGAELSRRPKLEGNKPTSSRWASRSYTRSNHSTHLRPIVRYARARRTAHWEHGSPHRRVRGHG